MTLIKTDYSKYLEDISFVVGPTDDVPESMYMEFDEERLPLPWIADVENTELPFGDYDMKERLLDICTVPKMSTFAVGALINLIVSELPEDQVFLNIGVWHGFTFLCGLAANPDKKCIGVDNFSEFVENSPKEGFYRKFEEIKSDNHEFHEMDCFAYLEHKHCEKIGFYMYDGQHTEEILLKGLERAEPYFSDDCIVLIDDLNMGVIITRAVEDFVSRSAFKYTTLFKQHTTGNTHPSFWNGIILLQREK